MNLISFFLLKLLVSSASSSVSNLEAMNRVTHDSINVIFLLKSSNLLSLCGNLHMCKEFMLKLRHCHTKRCQCKYKPWIAFSLETYVGSSNYPISYFTSITLIKLYHSETTKTGTDSVVTHSPPDRLPLPFKYRWRRNYSAIIQRSQPYRGEGWKVIIIISFLLPDKYDPRIFLSLVF